MADIRARFNIHLNMTGTAKGIEASKREVEDNSYNAVNYVIREIAFKAAANQQRNIQNQLEAKFTGIVMSELTKMGRKITTQAIGLGPGHRYPIGRLELEGAPNRYLAAITPGLNQPMNISTVTGQWRARTEEYLRRKAKKFGHRKWWVNSGDLKNAVRTPSMWIGAYGPVRVAWHPAQIQKGFSGSSAIRISTLARGQGRSYVISTGKIEVKILGRITTSMLAQPNQHSYDSRFTGLLEYLPTAVERKLANRGNPYRPVIEPFLTYYINRQIPNSIFNALTQNIKRV